MFPPLTIPASTADIQVYKHNNFGQLWSNYNVPEGKMNLFIMCIGAGSGGGGGFSGIAGSPRGGGGGGASGSIATLFLPTHLIPKQLFVSVSKGGAGGAAGVSGSLASGNSQVSISSIFNGGGGIPDPLVGAFNPIAGNAGAGTATGGGAGGSAAGTPTIIGFGGLGLFNGINGQPGVAGGAHTGAVGTSQSFPVTGINVMGGCGGAGTTSADFAGGGINTSVGALFSECIPPTAAAGSFDGSCGFSLPNFLFNFPGLGGSSSNTGVGGNGGDGGYGCGGGGGGGGTTGGKGGRGGDGLVIMIAW